VLKCAKVAHFRYVFVAKQDKMIKAEVVAPTDPSKNGKPAVEATDDESEETAE
jgi:hypothetical protein